MTASIGGGGSQSGRIDVACVLPLPDHHSSASSSLDEVDDRSLVELSSCWAIRSGRDSSNVSTS